MQEKRNRRRVPSIWELTLSVPQISDRDRDVQHIKLISKWISM
jgi:hypothetical protein